MFHQERRHRMSDPGTSHTHSPTRKPRRGRARRGWAFLAVALSAASLGVELSTHICAEFFFDPLPDATAVIAYGFLAFVLLFNEHMLRDRENPVGGASPAGHGSAMPVMRVLALWETGAALAIAAAYTAM